MLLEGKMKEKYLKTLETLQTVINCVCTSVGGVAADFMAAKSLIDCLSFE